jgi:hypothetical protein
MADLPRRRHEPRYAADYPCQVWSENAEAPTRGRLRGLSRHGAAVRSTQGFPLGAVVRLELIDRLLDATVARCEEGRATPTIKTTDGEPAASLVYFIGLTFNQPVPDELFSQVIASRRRLI